MSKCDCPCCQVYGPIPQDYKPTRKERQQMKREAKEAIDRFKREDPKGYQELVDGLKAWTQEKP